MSPFARLIDRLGAALSPRRRAERRSLDALAAYNDTSADPRFRKILKQIVDTPGPNWPEEEKHPAYSLPSQRNIINSGHYRNLLGEYLVAGAFATDQRMLDVSCGLGWGSYLLSLRARSVVALEPDPAAVEYAQAVWSRPNLHFLVADPLASCFPLGTFDAVAAFWTIERCPRNRLAALIESFARLLVPGGALVGVTHFARAGSRPAAAMDAAPGAGGTVISVDHARELMKPFFRDLDIVDLRLFKARRR